MTKPVKFHEMLASLRRSLEAIPEHRTGRNTRYRLVDGVDVAEPASGPGTVTGAVTGTTHKVHYLQSIPVDPFTTEAEWGKRSYQDDWDATSWGRENVYDVYSLFEGKALDGTYYRDW